MKAVDRYREMVQQLAQLRDRNQGHDSEEEDALLDDMDVVWATLTPEERALFGTSSSNTGTKQGRDDYLVWLRAIKKRPQMCLLPAEISVETLYVLDRTWRAARSDYPRIHFVKHLAQLKGTGNVVASSKKISFEEALDELIKLVENADVSTTT